MQVLTKDERTILELELLLIESEQEREKATGWIVESGHPMLNAWTATTPALTRPWTKW